MGLAGPSSTSRLAARSLGCTRLVGSDGRLARRVPPTSDSPNWALADPRHTRVSFMVMWGGNGVWTLAALKYGFFMKTYEALQSLYMMENWRTFSCVFLSFSFAFFVPTRQTSTRLFYELPYGLSYSSRGCLQACGPLFQPPPLLLLQLLFPFRVLSWQSVY